MSTHSEDLTTESLDCFIKLFAYCLWAKYTPWWSSLFCTYCPANGGRGCEHWVTIHIACESQKGNNPFKRCISDLFILSVFRICYFVYQCVHCVCTCSPVSVVTCTVQTCMKNALGTLSQCSCTVGRQCTST